MVYKYGGEGEGSTVFERGLLANANRGGENVATGALLGALLGASAGFEALPAGLVDGLAPGDRAALDAEVDAFVAVAPFVQAGRTADIKL